MYALYYLQYEEKSLNSVNRPPFIIPCKNLISLTSCSSSYIVCVYRKPVMSNTFPDPGISYGKRIIISVIEQRARDEPDVSWISAPADYTGLPKGYRDIAYKEINNAANCAAQWFLENLPASSKPFQPIAYAGLKDPRYVIFAVAAGKLQKKGIMPFSLPSLGFQTR